MPTDEHAMRVLEELIATRRARDPRAAAAHLSLAGLHLKNVENVPPLASPVEPDLGSADQLRSIDNLERS